MVITTLNSSYDTDNLKRQKNYVMMQLIYFHIFVCANTLYTHTKIYKHIHIYIYRHIYSKGEEFILF